MSEGKKILHEALIEARLRKVEEILEESECVSVPQIPFKEFIVRVEKKMEKRERRMTIIENIRFENEDHKERFDIILDRMASEDCYHLAVAYLLSLDGNLTDGRINRCFDFGADCIRPAVLEEDWITGTDRRIFLLAFALWNDANKADVNDVFGYSETEYLLEAVRIRFN